MNRSTRICLRTNQKVILLFFGSAIVAYLWTSVPDPREYRRRTTTETTFPVESVPGLDNEFEPDLENLQKISMPPNNGPVVRPRFHATELGIRKKLLISVLVEPDQVESLMDGINATSTHLVDSIQYFVNTEETTDLMDDKQMITFDDIRREWPSYHMIKYVAHHYLELFDFFLMIPATTYVDSRSLVKILKRISVREEIYSGTPVLSEDGAVNCDFDAGIIFSNNLLGKLMSEIDQCSDDSELVTDSENIRRCVEYVSNIKECQKKLDGKELRSFRLNENHHGLYRDFYRLVPNRDFNKALFVHPLKSSDDFFRLHMYQSRLQLDRMNSELARMEEQMSPLSNFNIEDEFGWPLGIPAEVIPDARFDVPEWEIMNRTHLFNYHPEINTNALSKMDSMDVEEILNAVLRFASKEKPHLQFQEVHSVYRKFDGVRGMDYKLILSFNTQDAPRKRQLVAFDVVRPLGRIDIIPTPFVSEEENMAILMPTFEHQIAEVKNFMSKYKKFHKRTFLMLVLLYNPLSPARGDEDVFSAVKDYAWRMSRKYKTKIAWTQLRLPMEYDTMSVTERLAQTSTYAGDQIMSVAVADLGMSAIPDDTLVLIASNAMSIRGDFLDRVRMNTMPGHQVFSPIGFQKYPCGFTGLCKTCSHCDVTNELGYFDKTNEDVIAFYKQDYVEARESLQYEVPIIHSDREIPLLQSRTNLEVNSVLDVFKKATTDHFILRVVEPRLQFGDQYNNYMDQARNIPTCPAQAKDEGRCARIASKKQYGKLLLEFLSKKGLK